MTLLAMCNTPSLMMQWGGLLLLRYVIAPNGMVYKNGVVQSSPNKGVHIAELEDTGFVKYCTFNYIVYDLAPGMGLEFPLSRYTVMTDDGSWDF